MTHPPNLEAAVRPVTSVQDFLIQERTRGLWREKKGTRPACGPESLIPSSTKVEQKYSWFWLLFFSLAAAAGIWHRQDRSIQLWAPGVSVVGKPGLLFPALEAKG